MELLLKKERIQYIDAMRGFTMLLVVFAHIETFSFDYASTGKITFLGEMFQLFRMPLFFFVSGFIAYKAQVDWNIRYCKDLIKKKFRVQFISTAIIGLAYTYLILNKGPLDFFASSSKYGYWFTIVLLEMFLIYYLVRLVCSKISFLNKLHLPLLVIISAVFLLLYRIAPQENTIINALSAIPVFKYFHFFIAGMIASRYKEYFFRFLDNCYGMALIVITFIISLYLNNNYNTPYSFIVICLAGYCGLITVFSFFRRYQKSFESTTKIGSILQYIGKRTLDIYLLHYFLLPSGLTSVGSYLATNSNLVIEFLIVIFLASLVVGGCLLISNIIRLSQTLAKYLLGA